MKKMRTNERNKTRSKTKNPFWVIVRKEVGDYARSWKALILIILITLTCMSSLYSALSSIGEAVKSGATDDTFLFLKLFTLSDGALPSFAVFIGFLGPLLGIALGNVIAIPPAVAFFDSVPW